MIDEYFSARISLQAATTVVLTGQSLQQWLIQKAISIVQETYPNFRKRDVKTTDIVIEALDFWVRFNLPEGGPSNDRLV